MTIELGKQYRTRDGRKVRVYAVDGGGEFCVHGAILVDDTWISMAWRGDGSWIGKDSSAELIEVKPRIKRKFWVNVYKHCVMGDTHIDRESADKYDMHRIACVEIDIDVEEGHGL